MTVAMHLLAEEPPSRGGAAPRATVAARLHAVPGAAGPTGARGIPGSTGSTDARGIPGSTGTPRTQAERHELVIAWMPLARTIAAEYLARAPRHVDRDDILSAAFLGLVEAANRHEESTGVPFSSWAGTRIRGAVLDAARAADVLPRTARRAVRLVQDAHAELEQHSPGAVSDREVAASLGWDVEKVRTTKAAFGRGVVASLDAVIGDGTDDSYAARLVDADPTPLERLERAELDRYVADAVAALPPRLADVLTSYYLDGEASTDTAERLGLTTQRVGQLRKEALELLRAGLGAQYDDVRASTGGSPEGADQTSSAAASRRAERLASYAASVASASTFAQRVTL